MEIQKNGCLEIKTEFVKKKGGLIEIQDLLNRNTKRSDRNTISIRQKHKEV